MSGSQLVTVGELVGGSPRGTRQRFGNCHPHRHVGELVGGSPRGTAGEMNGE